MNGWRKEGNYWYYYINGRKVRNSWQKDSVNWCYLGSDGRMVTNSWQKDSSSWYYLGSDGRMVTNSWKKDGASWYYFGPDGRATTGRKNIGGVTYTFDNNCKGMGAWPTLFNRVTNPYVPNRNPNPHIGIDFGLEYPNKDKEEPVMTFMDGVVCDVRETTGIYDKGEENSIKIFHDDPFRPGQIIRSNYQHLKYKPNYKVGDIVSMGEKIGIMGTTGNSEHTHLHFEIRKNIRGLFRKGSRGAYNDGDHISPVPFLQRLAPNFKDK